MARRKTTAVTSNWKPTDIFLLPKEYKSGMTFPGIVEKDKIQERGFGRCSLGEGLDRSWTLGELSRHLMEKYPKHRDEMKDHGVQFGRLLPGSKKITIHVTKKGCTVAKLEQMHVPNGILVILINQPESIETEPQRLVEPRDINIAHLNCQSVRNKLQKLRNLLDPEESCPESRIDVFTISETWLKPSDKSEKFAIPGFAIVARQDRVGDDGTGTGHGGVMVYARDHLVPCIEGGGGGGGEGRGKEDSGFAIDKDLEAVYVNISLDGYNRNGKVKNRNKSKISVNVCTQRKVLRVVNVYIPPATRAQVAQLKKLKEALCELKASDCCQTSGGNKTTGGNSSCKCQISCVILGDFNCDWLMIGEDVSSTIQEKLDTLHEMEICLKLKQIVQDLTRVRKIKEKRKDTYITTRSLIDLIFTDERANIGSSGVIQLDISDHFMVYCCWILPVSGGYFGAEGVKTKSAQKASPPTTSTRPMLPVVRYPKQAPCMSKSGGSLGTEGVKTKSVQKASPPTTSNRPLLPVVRYPKQAPCRSKSKEREQ